MSVKEEKEVKKDIEWLKERVSSRKKSAELNVMAHREGLSEDFESRVIAYESVLKLINQLDEPEVLAQELPSIPQIVAEWYESEGKRSSWWNWFYKWGRDEHRTDLETKAIGWMQDYNEEVFVNMFRYGYEVEEEQKYYVMNNDNRMMLVRMTDGKTITEADPFKLEDMYETEKKSHRLTEQEIKDYDIRYWAFRKPVEEMEE